MREYQTAVSIVGDHLHTLLLNDRLKVGDSIPAERQLARELGVCRQKIREGINHFGAKGILKRIHGVGTFVVTDASALTIVAPIQRMQSQMQETRRTLEPYIVSLASQRASKENLTGLAGALRNMFQALDDVDSFRMHDIVFHRVLAQACGNPILTSIMDGCGGFHSACICDGSASTILSDLADRHRKLYRAVRSGNSQKARLLMEDLSDSTLVLRH